MDDDSPSRIVEDVAAVARIDVVPSLLRIVCETTGMGFSAVARVTAGTWTACAVHDAIQFGLQPGGQLDVRTTLCRESRQARAPVVIEHASEDPQYKDHHTPRIYGIESYISVPIVLPDGTYFGNLCAIDRGPAKVSDPRVIGMFLGFAQLIAAQLANDRASALQQRALMNERAERELREQFIAILGHDLRGPLSGVLAGAEYLQRPAAGLDARAAAVATRIVSSARRMSALIDDILDFARGRLGGGFELRMADVHDVGDALREVAAEQQATHPTRELVVEIAAAHPVRCDRGRLQQLASNFLANALIHGSPATPVRLSAKVDDAWIVLTVTNEGEPIPEASLPHLFTPFWRRSQAGARQGLGLGLFICDQIVKAHGGTIEVISSADSGTTFAARLPIVVRSAQVSAPAAKSECGKARNGAASAP
jgi:signal transduction histidine kinase